MTEARTNDLAKQLLKGCPGARDMNTGARDKEKREVTEPLANGELSQDPVDPSTLHASPATPPFDPWDVDAAIAASQAQPEASQVDEIKKGKQENRIAPIANGKSSTPKRSKFNASRSKTKQPATIHHPRSTTNDPLANGKNGKAPKVKNNHKKAKLTWLQPLAKQLNGN